MTSTQDRQSWLARRHEALLWLMMNFPLAFLNGVKPLKIGIHQDIFNANQEGMPAKRWIRYALKHYVTSYTYLSGLEAFAVRFDLQGMPHGLVSDQEAINAKALLRSRKKMSSQPSKPKKAKAPVITEGLPENGKSKRILTLKKKLNQPETEISST